MSEKNSKSQSIGCISIVVIVLVAALSKTVVKALFDSPESGSASTIQYDTGAPPFGTNNDKYEEILRITAERLSAQLPTRIDADTIWQGVTPGPGRVFTYTYKITSATKDQIDFAEIERSFRPKLINSYRSQSGMKVFRDFDVELRYEYFDQLGQPITTISISPRDF